MLDRLQRSGLISRVGAGGYYLELASRDREQGRTRQVARVAAGVLMGIATVVLL